MGVDSRVRPSGADLFDLITGQKRVLVAHRWHDHLIVETEMRRGGRPFPVPFVLAYRTGFDGTQVLLDAHAGAASVVVDGDGYLFLADASDADRLRDHGGRVLRRRFPDRTETVLGTARGLTSYAAAAGAVVAAAWADPDSPSIEADDDAYAIWRSSGELAAFPGPAGWPHLGHRPDYATLRLIVRPGRLDEPALVPLALEPDVELTGEIAVTPDGRHGAAGLARTLPDGNRRFGLYLFTLDEAAAGRAYWKSGADLSAPVASPDGAWFACTAERVSTPRLAPHRGVFLLSPDGGRTLDVTAVHDDWLEPQAWHEDDVLCVGAVDGRRRLWRMSATSGAITLLDVDGSAASVTVSENEALVVRSAVDCPPEVVAVKLYAGDPGEIVYAPATAARPPGRLERQEWRDEDGTAWQAWLCLPGEEPATPLPVLVWCHGGPMLSWTDWSWRWNPWPFVADGHAVLMIDPPLSLGYGKQSIARGWGHWLTEVARVAVGQVRGLIGRDARLDSSRIATMGASFGGWLSIALATLMPEVRLVAAHAGWADVAGVARTCDLHWHWLREYGPPSGPNYARETPQLDNIHPSCRLLLSHGVQDGHVPVHEVFGVQRALTTRGVDVRLMILPDEGHSIRRPANAAAWFRWVRRACAEMWGTGR